MYKLHSNNLQAGLRNDGRGSGYYEQREYHNSYLSLEDGKCWLCGCGDNNKIYCHGSKKSHRQNLE